MITNKPWLMVIYFSSMILFINYSSPFIFWILTELNLLLFIMVVYLFKNISFKQEMFDLMMFYFIIQSMASILLLSDFFFSEDFFIFNSDSMFFFAILIKLGLFPFFYWVFKLSSFLNSKSLTLMLTLQKIPFFAIMFNSFSTLTMFILFLSFLFGSLLVLFSKNLIFLLVSSSISSSFWLFFLYESSFYLFLLYFILYSLFLFCFLRSYLYDPKSYFSFWISIMFFGFLLGLSPLSLFFFKFYISNLILSSFSVLDSIFFWSISFVTLLGYMKFSIKSFFYSFDLYSSFLDFKLNQFFFFISMIFFFSFMF